MVHLIVISHQAIIFPEYYGDFLFYIFYIFKYFIFLKTFLIRFLNNIIMYS